MTIVKILWITVGVIWGLNFVISCIARRKAKKAAMQAATVTVTEDPDVTDAA